MHVESNHLITNKSDMRIINFVTILTCSATLFLMGLLGMGSRHCAQRIGLLVILS